MKDYLIRSKGVLIGAIGLLALAVSGAVWGINNLGASDPDVTAIPTESPEKIAQVREILFRDEAVKGILAGRHEGRDYWMRIDMMYERENVDKTGEPSIAAVLMWFDPPVSWEGQVPTRSDPCDSYENEEGWLTDKNHPCINEPREYGTSFEEFGPTNGITAGIDLRLGQVYAVVEMGGSPDAIREAKKLYATPGSPEQDARVREILFQREDLQRAVADREEGRDYWVRIFGYIYAPGEPLTSEQRTFAVVDVYFQPPAPWPIGDEGGLPPRLVRGISAGVNLRSEQVEYLDLTSPHASDIEDAKARYEQ